MPNKYTGLEIAIIGMAGKFPGAKNINEFWENLKNKRECVTHFSDEELAARGIDQDLIKSPDYVKSAMVLEEKNYFDSNFFNYSPIEASFMSPQARIMHECVWTAIEDAGICMDIKNVPVALISGASTNLEWLVHTRLLGPNDNLDSFRISLLSAPNFMNTLVAYNLDLKGPAIYVETACSTSLSAVHLACRNLLTGDSKIAIAGGVTIHSRATNGYIYQEDGIFSADGHCRAFNIDASGAIGGEGAAFVVLKKLQDAIHDGDRIYAVIKGSAMNNDGRRKVGFTAPSIDGQSECIRIAHKIAGIDPSSISYIEAHGSGTKLGDPIEVMALRKVFDNGKEFSAALTTVKSNIGHLDVTAGIAGLIKATLSLWNKTIPPVVYDNAPLAELKWGQNGFYLNTALKPWQRKDNIPLRAGVSSFGLGGTNAHVVLEEAPEAENTGHEKKYKLLTISAKTEKSLYQFRKELTAFLSQASDTNLTDMCYTLQKGRNSFDYRKYAVFATREELLAVLATENNGGHTKSKNRTDSVAFIFSGLGSQYPGMCQELYESEPVFRLHVQACCEKILDHTGIDILPILYPQTQSPVDPAIYLSFDMGQYLVLTVEYSMAQLLMEWGIRPDCLMGYSFGEYVAACISGVFSLSDAIKIIHKRAELIKSLPKGSMLSIPITRKEIVPFLNDEISLSIDNGYSCVVAGSHTAIAILENNLKDQRLICTRLNSEYAVHSHMMEPVLENLRSALLSVQLNKPAIPLLSNVTGDWVTTANATDPAYWARQLRETVLFAEAMDNLTRRKNLTCVGIGTGNEISILANRFFEAKGIKEKVVNVVRAAANNISDCRYLLNGIGYLWHRGVNVDWKNYYRNEKRKKISLPTYCFEQIRYETEVNFVDHAYSKDINAQIKTDKSDPQDWTYFPVWEKSFIRFSDTKIDKRCYLLFSVGDKFTDSLIQQLTSNGNELIEIRIGSSFQKLSKGRYVIHPSVSDDYQALFDDLNQEGFTISDVIHTWSTGIGRLIAPLYEDREALDWIYFSFQKIIKGLLKVDKVNGKRFIIITDRLQKVVGDEEISYCASLLLGMMKVIPQEFSAICNHIDINLAERSDASLKKLGQEIQHISSERTIAYRNGIRWTLDYKKSHDPIRKKDKQVKKGAVYLITGGLGELGYLLIEYLLKEHQAKVVVIGRSRPNTGINQKLNALRAISNEIAYFSCDITSFSQLLEVKNQIQESIGPVSGIIHAAGITDHSYFELIEDMTIEKSSYLFAPKLKGIENIYRLFKDEKLDFVWITSSLAAIVGGLSYASYSAANLFMDYFILSKEEELPSWKCIDLGALYLGNDSNSRRKLKNTHLNREEVCRLFDWSLTVTNQPLLVVTKDNLHKIITDTFTPKEQKYLDTDFNNASVNRIERPNLVNDYVPPETELQKKITGMIEQLFGIGNIGIEDNFFDLGGDSLKALVLIRRIKKEINVTLSVNDFFRLGNVRQIAILIEDVLSVLMKNERASKMII